MNMTGLEKYWGGLQHREKITLILGGLTIALLVFYVKIWRPWHVAIENMSESIQPLRSNLIWMRQQSDNLALQGGSVEPSARFSGADQSLVSVVEQTANRAQIKDAIQQLVPNQAGTEVRVVLDDVNFNLWVGWIDMLFTQYGVDVKQVTAERDEDVPNVAEVRVTFVR